VRTERLTALVRRCAVPFLLAATAAALFGAVLYGTVRTRLSLGEPALVSGYALLALALLLAAFNLRKRLNPVARAPAASWKRLHVVGGSLALALFWLHVGAFWPIGPYERALAVLFYGVTASGLFGYACQQFYPRRLAQTGVEVIFERVPDEIAALRERAEAAVLACTETHHSNTLARFYVETFQWFFRKPRFLLSHLWGGQRAAYWVAQQLTSARRYLGPKEHAYLDELGDLAHAKARLDLHYAVQGLLKIWLHVHVPVAAGMLVLALWHTLIVNIYRL